MAVKVREGIDYKILPDDYRAIFNKNVKPIKRKREVINGVSQEVRYYKCMYCGHIIPHYEMEVDHIIPKTRLYAGILWNPNKAWNLGPSCKVCNIQKSNYIDERVIIGFKNKLLGRYGMGAGENAAYNSGDDESQKWKVYCIMGLVGALSVIAPVLLITAKGLEYILVYGSKFLRWASKKILFKLTKKLFNIVTSAIKHPIKTVKTLAVLDAGYIAINYTLAVNGLTFRQFIEGLFRWLFSII